MLFEMVALLMSMVELAALTKAPPLLAELAVMSIKLSVSVLRLLLMAPPEFKVDPPVRIMLVILD